MSLIALSHEHVTAGFLRSPTVEVWQCVLVTLGHSAKDLLLYIVLFAVS